MPVGHVVLLTGRTEYLEKAAIPATAWLQRGYTVISLDWRGQGLSDRQVDPGTKGHVGSLAEFQADLDALLADPMAASLPGPGVLMGHSMGGAIAARALTRPDVASRFAVATLSAPMIDITLGWAARRAAKATVAIARLTNRLDRWPPFGDMQTPYVLSEPSPNVLTQDDAVWRWMAETARTHPELALAMPTLGWFGAAFAEIKQLRTLPSPTRPALCVVGSAEEVVDPAAVQTWCAQAGVLHETIAHGRHELLIETAGIRADAWRAIDAFLATHGLPTATTSGN